MIRLSIAIGISVATGFMCYYIGFLRALHRLKAERHQMVYGPDFEVAERKIEDGMEMARFTDKE